MKLQSVPAANLVNSESRDITSPLLDFRAFVGKSRRQCHQDLHGQRGQSPHPHERDSFRLRLRANPPVSALRSLLSNELPGPTSHHHSPLGYHIRRPVGDEQTEPGTPNDGVRPAVIDLTLRAVTLLRGMATNRAGTEARLDFDDHSTALNHHHSTLGHPHRGRQMPLSYQ